MLRLDELLIVADRQTLGIGNRLLELGRKFIEAHGINPRDLSLQRTWGSRWRFQAGLDGAIALIERLRQRRETTKFSWFNRRDRGRRLPVWLNNASGANASFGLKFSVCATPKRRLAGIKPKSFRRKTLGGIKSEANAKTMLIDIGQSSVSHWW
jgi:hypothetical protein